MQSLIYYFFFLGFISLIAGSEGSSPPPPHKKEGSNDKGSSSENLMTSLSSLIISLKDSEIGKKVTRVVKEVVQEGLHNLNSMLSGEESEDTRTIDRPISKHRELDKDIQDRYSKDYSAFFMDGSPQQRKDDTLSPFPSLTEQEKEGEKREFESKKAEEKEQESKTLKTTRLVSLTNHDPKEEKRNYHYISINGDEDVYDSESLFSLSEKKRNSKRIKKLYPLPDDGISSSKRLFDIMFNEIKLHDPTKWIEKVYDKTTNQLISPKFWNFGLRTSLKRRLQLLHVLLEKSQGEESPLDELFEQIIDRKEISTRLRKILLNRKQEKFSEYLLENVRFDILPLQLKAIFIKRGFEFQNNPEFYHLDSMILRYFIETKEKKRENSEALKNFLSKCNSTEFWIYFFRILKMTALDEEVQLIVPRFINLTKSNLEIMGKIFSAFLKIFPHLKDATFPTFRRNVNIDADDDDSDSSHSSIPSLKKALITPQTPRAGGSLSLSPLRALDLQNEGGGFYFESPPKKREKSIKKIEEGIPSPLSSSPPISSPSSPPSSLSLPLTPPASTSLPSPLSSKPEILSFLRGEGISIPDGKPLDDNIESGRGLYFQSLKPYSQDIHDKSSQIQVSKTKRTIKIKNLELFLNGEKKICISPLAPPSPPSPPLDLEYTNYLYTRKRRNKNKWETSNFTEPPFNVEPNDIVLVSFQSSEKQKTMPKPVKTLKTPSHEPSLLVDEELGVALVDPGKIDYSLQEPETPTKETESPGLERKENIESVKDKDAFYHPEHFKASSEGSDGEPSLKDTETIPSSCIVGSILKVKEPWDLDKNVSEDFSISESMFFSQPEYLLILMIMAEMNTSSQSPLDRRAHYSVPDPKKETLKTERQETEKVDKPEINEKKEKEKEYEKEKEQKKDDDKQKEKEKDQSKSKKRESTKKGLKDNSGWYNVDTSDYPASSDLEYDIDF